MHDPMFLAQKSEPATEADKQEIEVEYLDQNFQKKKQKYSGWTAQIIQHEIDHCNNNKRIQEK